jgi:glucosamine--fructose-6-phosphate aminotransferase (isomerizing)
MDPYEPDVMLTQAGDLGNLIKTKFYDIDRNIQLVFNNKELEQIQTVYAFGDGDSMHAAYAAEMAFSEFSGVTFIAREALRFLEYDADYLQQKFPYTPLVVGISASGETKRIVEAINRVKSLKREIQTAVIVGNTESSVAKAAEKIVSVSIPDFGPSPGLRTYSASFLGLLALAIRIGEAKKLLSKDDVSHLHREIMDLEKLAEQTTEASLAIAKNVADVLSEAKFFSFVGSGPSYGSAMFSSAKLVETAGVFSVAQDLEEWAHVESHAYPLDYPVFMIAPEGKSMWRAEKLSDLIVLYGHPLIVVTHSENLSLKSKSNFFFPVSGDIRECFSPLVYHIPASILAYYIAKKLSRLPFMLDRRKD